MLNQPAPRTEPHESRKEKLKKNILEKLRILKKKAYSLENPKQTAREYRQLTSEMDRYLDLYGGS